MKKYYKDFIGTKIDTKLSLFNKPIDCLKKELYERICKELNYKNGLLCGFTEIKVYMVGECNYISGIVTKCEVDC